MRMYIKENKKYDVVCVGSCVQDILIEGIDREIFSRPVTVLKNTVFTVGGDAANEAVVLGRLGDRVCLAAKIDNGPVGDAIYRELLKEGIDLCCLIRDEQSRSSSAFVILGEDGEHRFLLNKGENEGIALEDINMEVLKRARAVCIGSLYTTYKLGGKSAERLMKLAKAAGAITFADLDNDVNGLGPGAMDNVYQYVDYLLPSIDEAGYITGMEDEKDAAADLLSKGAGTVVIKLGKKGCYVRNAKEEFYAEPFRVKAEDTTGCGDNFVAGFIHCVLRGDSLYDCARFACAAGAVNALSVGAHMAVKGEGQIQKFMESAGE